MSMRTVVLLVGLVAIPMAAFADELAGSWRLQTSDITSGRGCTLEGALVLKETSGVMGCELTLIQQCVGQKKKHLIVREPCSYSRKGDDVLIKGTSYEILEDQPPGEWEHYYKLDTFDMKLLPDGATMTGRFKGMAQARATMTRMRGLAE